MFTDESNKKCIQCSSSCSQCKLEDPQCCSSCPVSQFLLNCDCLDKCPEKYWTDYENSLCKTCDEVNCNIVLTNDKLVLNVQMDLFLIQKETNVFQFLVQMEH